MNNVLTMHNKLLNTSHNNWNQNKKEGKDVFLIWKTFKVRSPTLISSFRETFCILYVLGETSN